MQNYIPLEQEKKGRIHAKKPEFAAIPGMLAITNGQSTTWVVSPARGAWNIFSTFKKLLPRGH